MNNSTTNKVYLHNKNNSNNTTITIPQTSAITTSVTGNNYCLTLQESALEYCLQTESTIERVAQWFLSMSPMTHKKLQKLCYYAYCWFIVYYNDLERITEDNMSDIRVLCSDRFQAWIHGPVSPRLYQRYREYGWQDIPKVISKPTVPAEIETLLTDVWDAYGSFTAAQLEAISHSETPWKNARRGLSCGEACSNEISNYDILIYYSSLE